MVRNLLTLLPLLLIPVGMFAQKKSIMLPPDNPMAELKPGDGLDLVRKNCRACHSTDYIVQQPNFEAAKWDAEVRKMIITFGAPIKETDIQVLVDYLTTNYGSN